MAATLYAGWQREVGERQASFEMLQMRSAPIQVKVQAASLRPGNKFSSESTSRSRQAAGRPDAIQQRDAHVEGDPVRTMALPAQEISGNDVAAAA